MAQNRQIGVILCCFNIVLNTVNTDVFCVSEAQNHGIYASGNKNHGMYNVFWSGPSKNVGIYAVFSMLQEVCFPCQRHKTL